MQLLGAPPDDFYAFSLHQGDTATLALTELGGGNVDLALENAAGTVYALGSTGVGNVSEVISNFVAPATGTYYAHLTGSWGAQYSLVVTRNADFDTEDNNNLESAQDVLSNPVAGSQWVLGHVNSVGQLLGADNGD